VQLVDKQLALAVHLGIQDWLASESLQELQESMHVSVARPVKALGTQWHKQAAGLAGHPPRLR
jgi:hypothetical protein